MSAQKVAPFLQAKIKQEEKVKTLNKPTEVVILAPKVSSAFKATTRAMQLHHRSAYKARETLCQITTFREHKVLMSSAQV